jgi:3-deoxy-D-manno-octulosonate 8-phosphate phosphatase (KDO 8-P phosphatase)
MHNAFKAITCFVFDVDGVLTDGTLLVMDNGSMVRHMNIKDGYALQLAVKKGYQVAIISGSESEGVRLRLEKLGITNVYMKVKDKKERLKSFLDQHGISLPQVLYMGDDIPDYAVMKDVGMPCCPADAVPEIKNVSRYISSATGGKGCVRDVIEKVLKLNEHWDLDSGVASQ